MIDKTKNMLIGLFVVVAIGLIVGIILFIEPSVGDGKQTLIIRFSNINGISVGTRVAFAGKPVGEVVAIQTIPNARTQPVDELGQVYYYQLICHVDSHIKVYTTDEITVQTSGLLGEKSIAINPKAVPPGITPKLVTNKIPVYANSVDPFESAFHQLGELSEKVEDAVDTIITWVDKNGDAVGAAVRSFDRAMEEFGDTMASVNQSHIVDHVDLAIASFTATTDKVRGVIDELDQDQVFHNLAITMDNVKHASKSVEEILKGVQEGKGTIGRLVEDDDFYLRLTSILSKIDTAMNDINHYGILFNLNKEWQRSRQKRITALNALQTPDQFKDYFEGEIDTINTAMSRISSLIEKAEQTPEKERILNNHVFRKDFAELLRLTNDLLEHLHMYNEQLMEASSGGCK